MEAWLAEDYALEAGPMGPIGEGEALILRVNRNCPWNKCLFCPVYKGEKYSARSVQEIKGDIDAIHRIKELIETTSFAMGLRGTITKEAIEQSIINHPEIYGEYPDYVSQGQWRALQSLSNVSNWLLNGGRRVFLQDANALAVNPGPLTEVLQYLKAVFPTIAAVTCYARSKTSKRRSAEELNALRKAGLSWCFIGIESGSDDVLSYMKKGVTRKEHAEGVQKLMASGIHTAAFVMPGLGGNDKGMVEKHISDTITLLNEIQPTEVRVRSLALLEGTPLYERWRIGEFAAPGEDQMIEEQRRLIEGLTVECTFETLQMTNSLFSIKGKLSQKRSQMLESIAWYQALPPLERANFLLGRYLDDGYLDFVKAWDKYDDHLEQLIEDAKTSIAKGSDDALEKAERTIFAIKSKGVP